jgi:heat shock protein HslJ
MHMRWTTTGLLVGLALLTVGCGGDDDDTAAGGDPGSSNQPSSGSGDEPAAGASELVGRTFLSESVTENGQPRPLVDGSEITLSFPEDGRITFDSGCNHMDGTLGIEDDRLVVSEISMTEMACDPIELMDQEQWLAGVMDADPSYALDGERLRLESGDVVIELVDREVADPDRPLEGTTWQLDGMVQGGGPDSAASSAPVGVTATLLFEGGNVTLVNEGCNGGRGAAEVGDGTIRFDGIMLTRMGCPDPQAEVEAAITSVLQGEVTYEIQATSLTITHPDGQALTFQAAE